jgi:hypothetical protein
MVAVLWGVLSRSDVVGDRNPKISGGVVVTEFLKKTT